MFVCADALPPSLHFSCGEQRCKQACVSKESDKQLCYSLYVFYDNYVCYTLIFIYFDFASLCGRAGSFDVYIFANPKALVMTRLR